MSANDTQAAETQAFDMLVAVMQTATSDESGARITIGEAAYLIRSFWGWGGITRAAKQVNQEYKTIAERCRVVDYYQSIPSAGQIKAGESSIARELMAEFDGLTWTHLRIAKGVSKDPMVAMQALGDAMVEAMTPKQFKRHIAKIKRANGHTPTRIQIAARAGYTVTIRRAD